MALEEAEMCCVLIVWTNCFSARIGLRVVRKRSSDRARTDGRRRVPPLIETEPRVNLDTLSASCFTTLRPRKSLKLSPSAIPVFRQCKGDGQTCANTNT